MKQVLMIFMVLLATSAINAQTSGNKRNKCVTCGKLINACQYHGKHPRPKPPVGSSNNREVQRAQELNMYPEWFEQSTMKAIPISGGRTLIVYNKLQNYTTWNDEPDTMTIPGIPGSWNKKIDKRTYDAIASSALYVPAQGLYGGSRLNSKSSASPTYRISYYRINGRLEKRVETIPKSEEGKILIVDVITKSGSEEIECGGETEINEDGKIRRESTKKYITISFYPNRVIEKSNGTWHDVDESTERKVNVSSSASASTIIRVIRR
ncbi:MAG: hypothetical protein KBT15_07415 [Bacteroidales bacterium]|nr:hypothetical protein [Candidatus Minthousia equi]